MNRNHPSVTVGTSAGKCNFAKPLLKCQVILNVPKIKVLSGVPAWMCISSNTSLAAGLKPACPAIPV